MIAAIAMVSLKDLGNTGGNKISVIFAAISMAFASGVGIVQKIFANVYGKSAQNEFIFLAFMFMMLFGVLIKCALCHKNSKDNTEIVRENRRFYVFACATALCVALVNKLNVILITALPGVLYFPVYAAGTILCSAVFSKIIFKEELTRLQWTGVVCGVAAIVMIVL